LRALEARPELDVRAIGPLHDRLRPLLAARRRLALATGSRYQATRQPFAARDYARQVDERSGAMGADVVFSLSSIPVAHYSASAPAVFWTDATFAGLVDYYPTYSRLARPTLRNGHALEWAADTARQRYRVDPAKLRLVPRGASLDPGMTEDEARALVESRPSTVCRLLLVGRDGMLPAVSALPSRRCGRASRLAEAASRGLCAPDRR